MGGVFSVFLCYVKRFGKNFSLITCSVFVFLISLHVFVEVHKPREAYTFLGGHDLCFVTYLKEFFW